MDISVNLFGDYIENNQNNEMGSNFDESSKTPVSRLNILKERKNGSSEESSCVKRSDFVKKSSIASNSSSSKPPYDPVTNILSPRPKFLRYNPNRTPCRLSLSPRGIAPTDTQSGDEIDDDNVDDLDGDVDEQELVEDSDDEFDDDEDEFEERSWNLKWVLKALIISVALFFSADYISNMNSPIAQPLRKNAVCLVPNHLVDVVSLKCFEDGDAEFVVDKLDETKVGTLLDLNERVGDEFDVNMELTECGGIEDDNARNIDETELGLLDLKEIVDDELDDNMGLTHVMSENGVESIVDHVMSENGFCNGEIPRGEMYETHAEGYEESSNLNDEVVTLETLGSIDESNGKLTINWITQKFRTIPSYMTTKSITVGICAICSFVALLALGYHYKFKRSAADARVLDRQEHGEKISTSAIRPCSARSKEEKNVALATKNHESSGEKIESVATPCTLVHPVEEEQASKGEYYETRAPTVELLGEFEVGEMSCSSVKSCQKKSNRMMESDLSNYSIYREEIASWSNTRRQVRATPKQSFSQVSLTASPSCGSLTSEKRRQSEEITTPVRTTTISSSAKKVMTTTTPVRRSSRLQNRTALSP